MSLTDSVAVRQDIPDQVANAGVNGTVVDMQGWDGCLFIFNLGAMGAGATFDARIMASATATFSDAANVAGAVLVQVPNTQNSNVVQIDVSRPALRYLKSVTMAATATVGVGSVTVQYRRTALTPPVQSAAQTIVVVAS